MFTVTVSGTRHFFKPITRWLLAVRRGCPGTYPSGSASDHHRPLRRRQSQNADSASPAGSSPPCSPPRAHPGGTWLTGPLAGHPDSQDRICPRAAWKAQE
jgi:hypothetical protein